MQINIKYVVSIYVVVELGSCAVGDSLEIFLRKYVWLPKSGVHSKLFDIRKFWEKLKVCPTQQLGSFKVIYTLKKNSWMGATIDTLNILLRISLPQRIYLEVKLKIGGSNVKNVHLKKTLYYRGIKNPQKGIHTHPIKGENRAQRSLWDQIEKQGKYQRWMKWASIYNLWILIRMRTNWSCILILTCIQIVSSYTPKRDLKPLMGPSWGPHGPPPFHRELLEPNPALGLPKDAPKPPIGPWLFPTEDNIILQNYYLYLFEFHNQNDFQTKQIYSQ